MTPTSIDQHGNGDGTTYWFRFDNETFGVSVVSGVKTFLDSEGMPIDECNYEVMGIGVRALREEMLDAAHA